MVSVNSTQRRNPTSPPREERAIPLRAIAHAARASTAPRLAGVLETCECWTHERKSMVGHLQLRLETPLRTVADLYFGLMEAGLELDRQTHSELASLCTLARHTAAVGPWRRRLQLRLEVTFAQEIEVWAGGGPAETGVEVRYTGGCDHGDY